MHKKAQAFKLRPMRKDEWKEVAELIHDSTNSWYSSNGKNPSSQARLRILCFSVRYMKRLIQDAVLWRFARNQQRLRVPVFIILAALMFHSEL